MSFVGTNAAETDRNVNAVFGKDTDNERAVRFLFDRFHFGNFYQNIERAVGIMRRR